MTTITDPRFEALKVRSLAIARQLSSIHGYLAPGEADAMHALEVELGVTYIPDRGFQPLQPGCRCRLCGDC